MKLLMVTRADIGVSDYLIYTLPILRRYAEKWGAEFKILDKSYGPVFQRFLSLHKLFDEYDRIFYVDADIVINKACPNIFDIVPHDTIGFVFEDKGSRLKERRVRIAYIKSVYGGNESWVSGYFNIGILVVSRIHKEIFTKINGKFWGEDFEAKTMGADQTHTGYQIMKQGHKYIDLGYKWNHMSMFSEPWNSSPSRFDSHIIHYAGKAEFPDKGNRSKTQLMKDDIKEIYHAHLG